MLMFEMCLSGAANCWYLTLSDMIKRDFENLTEQFIHDYQQNNQWLSITRLKNNKLLTTESSDKCTADMFDLTLLVGIGDTELS